MIHSNVIFKIMLISIFLFTIPKTTYSNPRWFRRSRTPSPVKCYNDQFKSDSIKEISTIEENIFTYNKLLNNIIVALSNTTSNMNDTEIKSFLKKLKEQIYMDIFINTENATQYRREICFKQIAEYPVNLKSETIVNCVNIILNQLIDLSISLDL